MILLNKKQIITIIFIMLCLFGCSDYQKLRDNDPENSEMIKRYYATEGISFSDEMFQCKITDAYYIISEDGEYFYFWYSGVIAPTTDASITIGSVQFEPGNLEYFKNITSNSGPEHYSYPLYFPDTSTVSFSYNNEFKGKQNMPAYRFEYMIMSVKSTYKDFYKGSEEDFIAGMKQMNLIVSYNGKRDIITIKLPEISEIRKEEMRKGSLLERRYGELASSALKLDYIE